MMLITVLTLCCVCVFAETQQDRDHAEVNYHPTRGSGSHATHRDRLTVLLISVPSAGHVSPLLALGEELVRRGHNVTLCITHDPKFTESIRAKVDKVGVKLIATGQSIFKSILGENAGKGAISSGLREFPTVAGNEAEIILKFMETFIEQSGVDVVISEEFLTAALLCASHHYQIPSIIMSSTLQVMSYTYPSWPWPGMLSGAVSDNLTFQQRLFVPFERLMMTVLLKYIIFPSMQSIFGKFCPSLTHRYVAPSTHLPQIIPSVIGIEYPRTISPLTHYVGPVLTKSPDPLLTDLQMWLSEKHNRSVIYISMGSHMPVSEELGTAIVSTIAKTGYSAVWALRNSTLLETLTVQLDKSKLYVTSWAPQLSVLGHRAIRMAILHGGANGVHEALYNEIPVILLPQFGDQMFLAGRVSHNKLGVHIPAENLSSSSISKAIKEVDDGNYVRNIQRLKKIFVQAGGVERATDLVEHYTNVGYSHLVPAYAKYDWNWIQYYNVDVYLLLGTLFGLFLFTSFRCCKCVYKRCCTCFQSKEKAD